MSRTSRTHQRQRGPLLSRLPAMIGLPALIVVLVFLAVRFRGPITAAFSSAEGFRDWVRQRGVLGPLLFVAAQAAQIVIFVIPGEIPQVAAGYLFGFFGGSALTVVGALLGAAISFLLARLLGVPFVQVLFSGGQLQRVRRYAESARGRLAVFLIFLIPGLPKDVFCFAAGFTSMSLPTFLLLSTTGRLPGLMVSVAFGKLADESRWLPVGLAAAAAALLALLGYRFRDRLFGSLDRLAGRRERDSHRKGGRDRA